MRKCYRPVPGIFFFLFLFFFLGIPSKGQAQTVSEVVLSPELVSEVKSALSSTLNGIAVFETSDALGSGSFAYDEVGGQETDIDVLRFSNDFYLGERDGESFAPFIRALIGNVKLTESIPPFEGEGIADFSVTESVAVGVGLGVDIALMENLYLTPSFLFSYNSTSNKYDFNNESSQILAIFNREILNWNVDALGYMPGAELRYNVPLGEKTVITPSISYSQLFLDSFWSNSPLIDVNSSSGILTSGLRFDFGTDVQLLGGNLHLIPEVRRTDISRDAKDGLGFSYYYDFGFGAYVKDQNVIPFLSEVGITGGYGYADEFEGWRIGLDGRFS